MDFCFSSQVGDDSSWPLFVLLANSDVFCVDASLLVSSWNVEGPLEMKPSLENNYSDGEACSIVEVELKMSGSFYLLIRIMFQFV